MLHWIARARASLVPPATRHDAILVDLGCGGGLLAPHVAGLGYRHVGVDLVVSSLRQARRHGVTPLVANVNSVPLRDGCADVVCAGEILEHVPDPSTVVREACRVLRPKGTLVLDTVNATALSRLIVVTLGERMPGGAPKGIHDPALFVRPSQLVAECARNGVALTVRGLRPKLLRWFKWMISRRGEVPMVPAFSAAVLYQAWGVKEA
jgi:2-polyprenyl-6-hydroxyphenyl methylase / 3-demethylubiquinone-9 3-methyltransferase